MDESLAVVVLAGGSSTRMGSFKATIPFMGRPLIDHSIAIARRSSREVYILVNSREQEARIRESSNLRGARVILDHPGEGAFPNPMLASIRGLGHDLIFLMGCDMPFLDPRLPNLLRGRMGECSAAIPSWPNGFVEPLTALYRHSRLPKRRVSSLHELVRLVGSVLVPIGELGIDKDSFFNINTREDLQVAERMAQARSIST